MSLHRSSICTFGSIACLSTFASAQPFLRFDQVPAISTSSPETFTALFSGGHCRTVRALCFGDSQETCPGGWGDIYLPRLNYELWQRYGNSPESAFFGPDANTGSGLPYAEWLVRNAVLSTRGLAPSRLDPTTLPPNSFAATSSTVNGSNINNDQFYGAIYMLQPNAFSVNPGALLNGSTAYLNASQGVYLDVLAATGPESGGIAARATAVHSPNPTFFPAAWSPFSTTPPLELDDVTFNRIRFGPYHLEGRPYLQVELSGTDATKLTDIVGAAFVGVADDRGWAVTSFSAGGYHTFDFLVRHAGCGPMLTTLEPDVVFLAFGANDLGNGFTISQFHARTTAIISVLRMRIRPDLPIILLAEADREMLEAFEDAFDSLPGALHDIAQSMPNVCAVNGRLLTHAHGWSRDGNLAPFLADGVHYNAAGARLKAQVEIDALYSTFGQRCLVDLDDGSGESNPDCAVTIEDLLYFLTVFDAGTSAADLDDDGDPSTASPDEAVDINDLLFFLARFESGC